MPLELRRAKPPDADFLLELLADDDVRQFLGPRTAETRDEVLAEIERSLTESEGFGRFVIELDGEPAGMLGFHVANEQSRIARLERLAIHPRFRGHKLADEAARLFQRHLLEELGYHRLELEIYAFNERACAHAGLEFVALLQNLCHCAAALADDRAQYQSHALQHDDVREQQQQRRI